MLIGASGKRNAILITVGIPTNIPDRMGKDRSRLPLAFLPLAFPSSLSKSKQINCIGVFALIENQHEFFFQRAAQFLEYAAGSLKST